MNAETHGDGWKKRYEVFRTAEAEVVDVYRFSRGGGSMGWHRALVAVLQAEAIGYFCVYQECTCSGDAYACMRLSDCRGVPLAEEYADESLYDGWVMNEFFAPWMETDLCR